MNLKYYLTLNFWKRFYSDTAEILEEERNKLDLPSLIKLNLYFAFIVFFLFDITFLVMIAIARHYGSNIEYNMIINFNSVIDYAIAILFYLIFLFSYSELVMFVARRLGGKGDYLSQTIALSFAMFPIAVFEMTIGSIPLIGDLIGFFVGFIYLFILMKINKTIHKFGYAKSFISIYITLMFLAAVILFVSIGIFPEIIDYI